MREYRFWTYIMASVSGTLYTGITNNIEKRVDKHKSGNGSGFTSRYECTRLVFFERYQDVRKAIGREKQIKSWSRAKKIALIESANPRWKDLSEKWGWEYDFSGGHDA